MNKFTRFTLFAGMLAIGLTACGDDVEVVEPTPPPPPPVEATLEPASIAIELGESVNLSVNVSGGDPNDQATWECSSSNPSVATVSNSDTGCLVQASDDDDGQVSITAEVQKSGEQVNPSATVHVLPDTSVPATIIIEKVTQGNLNVPVALNNVARQIEVTVNIDAGTQVLENVDLLFRGEEIASFDLTPAQAVELLAAAGDDSPEAQVVRTHTFSWETDRYTVLSEDDVIDGTDEVVVDHLNGQGGLTAEATVADGSQEGETVRSASLNLTLRNHNGFHVKLERINSLNTANDLQGFEWRGGLDEAGNTDAGLRAHILGIVYTPDPSNPGEALDVQTAQFGFGWFDLVFPFGGDPQTQLSREVSLPDPWTFEWPAASPIFDGLMRSYSMPIAVDAYPNLVRDGEYPNLLGEASLTDEQGMGPYGGAVDCTGSRNGLINVEFTTAQLPCADGMSWTPPTHDLRLRASAGEVLQVLDPLRSGERIDNAPPYDDAEAGNFDFVLMSRPGQPNWPQDPSTPAAGAAVDSDGVWVNEGLNFAGIFADDRLTDDGVSREVDGFGSPEFGELFYEARGGAPLASTEDFERLDPATTELWEDNPAAIFNVRANFGDALDNRDTQNLLGDDGAVAMRVDTGDPIIMHTALSTPNRWSFDLVTGGADDPGEDPAITFYDVSWTDPATPVASGFGSFVGSPVWRQVHRVFPTPTGGLSTGVTSIVGDELAAPTSPAGNDIGVVPNFLPGTGLLNYTRMAASTQPVTGGVEDDGHYNYRVYVLDDAGNASRDDAEEDDGIISYMSSDITRQAAIAERGDVGSEMTPVVALGITGPPTLPGNATIPFNSNMSHTFDIGLTALSLDYPTFQLTPFWTAASSNAGFEVGPGSYWTPVNESVGPTVQGITGGVRFAGSDLIAGQDDAVFEMPSQIFDLDPDPDEPGLGEIVASLVPQYHGATRNIPNFIRSITWVCAAAGAPHADCEDATVWADGDAASVLGNFAGAPIGWFPEAGAASDGAYMDNRANLAAMTAWDATRVDERTQASVFSGTVNDALEQTVATDDWPNRSVATAPILPASVPLAATTPFTDDVAGGSGEFTAWGITSATANLDSGTLRNVSVSVTARLIGESAEKDPDDIGAQNPYERVDFFILEPGTGTLRYGASQMNPTVTENSPTCVDDTFGTQDQYRCWDFSASFTIQNLVNADDAADVQVLAIGVNSAGDGVTTYPVDGAGFP